MSALNAHLFTHGFVLIGFGIFLLLAHLFWGSKRFLAWGLSFASVIIALVCAFVGELGSGFYGLLVYDNLARLSSIVILATAALFLLAQSKLSDEFYALFLLMMGNFMALVSTSNLAVMFIALEASSLALFTMIAMRGGVMAIRASIVYFVYSAICGAFFCFGAALWYFSHHSLDVGVISDHAGFVDILCFVMILVLVLFKLSLAPLHLWLYDVYKHANACLSGFISVAPKMAIFVIGFRIFASNPDLSQMVFYAPCVFAMIFAGIMALRARSFKGTLVYSSLVNSAFVFTLVCAGFSDNMWFYTLMVYWAVFSFINMALFLFLDIVGIDDLADFAGFATQHRVLGGVVVFLLICLGAIPPFGLFYPKLMLMLSHAMAGNIMLVLSIAITSALIVVAYAKIIKALAFANAKSQININLSLPCKIVFALGLIAGAFAIFGVNLIDYLI